MNEPDDTDVFDTITEYVEEEMGFSSSYYEEKYLKRRIKSRMRRTKTRSYGDYFDVLRSDPEERVALLDTLSVNVTRFFRNPEVWEEVRVLLRELTSRDDRVKLWSAACSDGREAYSMAMLALDDPEIDESRIEGVTATDIDEDILDAARAGVYQSTQTVDVAEQLLTVLDDYEPYVDRENHEFRVDPRVKRMVSFERHDLISGDPKRGYGLVMCRNLMIYIDKEYKIPILETLGDSLRSGGYLVIGKTENLPLSLKDRYEPVNNRLRVYRRL